MQKVIEKAVIKITQEMERNRKAYNEARGSYNDTGYDRYYNKMTKLDAEYEDLKAFYTRKKRVRFRRFIGSAMSYGGCYGI